MRVWKTERIFASFLFLKASIRSIHDALASQQPLLEEGRRTGIARIGGLEILHGVWQYFHGEAVAT